MWTSKQVPIHTWLLVSYPQVHSLQDTTVNSSVSTHLAPSTQLTVHQLQHCFQQTLSIEATTIEQPACSMQHNVKKLTTRQLVSMQQAHTLHRTVKPSSCTHTQTGSNSVRTRDSFQVDNQVDSLSTFPECLATLSKRINREPFGPKHQQHTCLPSQKASTHAEHIHRQRWFSAIQIRIYEHNYA